MMRTNMRAPIIFFLFPMILMTLYILHRTRSREARNCISGEMNQLPPQQFCKKRPAVKCWRQFVLDDPIVMWSVTKITKMEKPYSKHLPLDKNVCSPFTFVDGCGTMRFTLTGWHPNYLNVQTVAYRRIDERNENVMVLDRTVTFKDDHYEVLHTRIQKIVYVTADGTATEEKEIPAPMNEIDGEPILYAMVAMGARDEWRMFQMCDRNVTWVAVPTEKARTDLKKYLKQYEGEINQKLRHLQVDTSSMVDIDTIEFPFEPKNQLPPFSFSRTNTEN